MNTYRYQMPENTGFAEYLEETQVADFDPHGFVADANAGDAIVRAVLERRGLVSAESWELRDAEGDMRLLYWDSAFSAHQSTPPAGEITKTRLPVEETPSD